VSDHWFRLILSQTVYTLCLRSVKRGGLHLGPRRLSVGGFLSLFPLWLLIALFLLPGKAQAVVSYVVISEVQIAGATTDDEFVELYNPTSAPIDLGGWRLTRASASGLTMENLVTAFAPGTLIGAYGFLLIAPSSGYQGGVVPDVYYTTGSRLASNNSVILYSDGGVTVVDRLGMGTASIREGTAIPNPGTGGSVERKAAASSSVASMGMGGGDAFYGNGEDTDDNSSDFVQRATSNPQNGSSPSERLPGLSLDPSATTLAQTEPVAIAIGVENGVDLAQATLTVTFDPALFAFDEAQFHGLLTPVSGEAVDTSTPGQVVVSQMGGPYTGSGPFVTLHFLAQTTPDTTSFSISSSTFINSGGNGSNGVLLPASQAVRVAATATLQGHLSVQGRTNHSGVAVYLYPGIINHTTTTDSSGFWQFPTAWPTRPNFLLFRRDGYLDRVVANVNAPEGQSTTVSTFMLKGGDANRDKVVNVQDLAFIGGRFGLVPLVGVDAQADLTGDGVVNVLDLTLAASNYGVVQGAGTGSLPEDVLLWLEAFDP
jgi:Lamin Tail Domain